MAPFLSGLELNRRFYERAAAPLLQGTPHAAARLGSGSEVLGFDTERSTDHGWGPRLLVVVDAADVEPVKARIDDGLPDQFEGWPTRYGWDDVATTHHVDVTTLADWSVRHLGFDATAAIATLDWLGIPQQALLEATAGAVYHDDAGALTALRARLAYYPDDVWLWMIGCQWLRVSQEEAFVGRAAEVGDELGSRLVAARIARELMRLWFLFARRYWPYGKWFGSAFSRLGGTAEVAGALESAVTAASHPAREEALARAYELTARAHNDLGVTDPVDPATRSYHGRPFQVLHAERFAAVCRPHGQDDLAALPQIGSVDQWIDSTDVLSHPDRARAAARRLLDA